ncbi:5692_t:CDS:1, partial [Cetraspora pellucida]
CLPGLTYLPITFTIPFLPNSVTDGWALSTKLDLRRASSKD